MNESSGDTPIFNYVAALPENREFILTIFEDGMSHWDDLSEGTLVERVLCDEDQASIVSVRISGEILAKAREMAAREKEGDARAIPLPPSRAETAADIAVMDRMLVEFFWHEVNPLLRHPLKPPNTGSC